MKASFKSQIIQTVRGLLVIAALYLPAAQPVAEEIMTMESTITGSQEQPQVMSIVPWQPPEPSQGLYRPITRGAVELEILQPLDREVFKREVRYYESLNSVMQNQ